MSKWRPEGWHTMVASPYMHDGVRMAKKNPEKALELELQHQAFRKGQEAGADSMLGAICEKIEKVDLPKYKKSWIVMTPEDTRQKILDHLRSNNEYD